jgi:hypothetical protein
VIPVEDFDIQGRKAQGLISSTSVWVERIEVALWKVIYGNKLREVK